MNKKTLVPLVGIVIILSMLIPACQTKTVVETVEVIKTVEVEVPGETVVEIVEVTAIPEEPVTITIWSHFANQAITRALVSKVFDDYEAAHPFVNIEVTWWDMGWICNGWLANIDEFLPGDNFVEGALEVGRCPGMDEGAYVLNPWLQMNGFLFYNPRIFEELGIVVPENNQFTQDEFKTVVKTCSDAGYAGIGQGIGNRSYTGQYPVRGALLQLVGTEEYQKYITGTQSWDTPEVRQVLEWVGELLENGLYPESFATLGIDEFHTYFHTQEKACMLYLGNWYTNRAFQAEDAGGQPADFRFGVMKAPLMDGAAGPNLMEGQFGTGYAVVSTSEHVDIAADILRFWAQPEYGARMSLSMHYPSAIKWGQDDIPEDMLTAENPYRWYDDMVTDVFGDTVLGIHEIPCGDFEDALTSAINEGFNLGLMTVDEVIEYMDAHLCN